MAQTVKSRAVFLVVPSLVSPVVTRCQEGEAATVAVQNPTAVMMEAIARVPLTVLTLMSTQAPLLSNIPNSRTIITSANNNNNRLFTSSTTTRPMVLSATAPADCQARARDTRAQPHSPWPTNNSSITITATTTLVMARRTITP